MNYHFLLAPWLESPCSLEKHDKYSCHAAPGDKRQLYAKRPFSWTPLTPKPCKYEDLESFEQIASLPHRHVPSPGPNILCQQLLGKWHDGDSVHKDDATFGRSDINVPFLVRPFCSGWGPAKRVGQHLLPTASPFLSNVWLRMRIDEIISFWGQISKIIDAAERTSASPGKDEHPKRHPVREHCVQGGLALHAPAKVNTWSQSTFVEHQFNSQQHRLTSILGRQQPPALISGSQGLGRDRDPPRV